MKYLGLLLSLAALWSSGCAQGGEPLDLSVDFPVPLTLRNHLVYFRSAEQQAVIVDVGSERPRVKRVDLPEGPCSGHVRPQSDEKQLVVLCEGVDATREDDEVPAELLLMNAGGVVRRYALPGRFEHFSLAEDGERAFVHGAVGGIVLATESAFVDLSRKAGDDNPRRVTVRSLSGEAPSGAVFGRVRVGRARRSLAVVLSPGHVNVFDLDHLEDGPITVPLSVEGDRGLEPEQIVFGERTLYVRARGLPHVVALSLEPGGAGSEGRDFSLALSTLPADAAVTQMLLLERDAGELLLVLAGDRAAVVDPSTGTSVSIETGATYTDAVRFLGASPSDGNPRDRALLYGDGSRVAFLDLDGLEARGARNLETVRLGAPVRGAYPMVDQGRVALLHAESNALSVVELEDRTVVPVRTRFALDDAVVDVERAHLWLRSQEGTVASLSLADFDASEVLLDEPAIALRLLPGEEPRLLAVHDGPEGFVTLLSRDDPSRAKAQSLRGFLWEGLLDQRSKL